MKKSKSKYAENVLANIQWFIKHRHQFDFSGAKDYVLSKIHCYKRDIGSDEWVYASTISEPSYNAAFGKFYPSILKGNYSEWKVEKETEDCIIYDKNGVDAVEAFVQIDSYGVVKPTKHPMLLLSLLRTKASLNLHIKMYAEDRANGRLPGLNFQEEIVRPFEFLPWMVDAVENQKVKYY